MKRILLTLGFLLAGSICAFSQKNQLINRDISEILDKNDFEKIMKFILTNGDRQTYCQKYNNNPHYVLDGFDIYLDPISQWINYTKDSLSYSVDHYDKIVIMDWNSTYIYYHLKLSNGRVYIYDIYKVQSEKFENEMIKKYIPKLKSLIKS